MQVLYDELAGEQITFFLVTHKVDLRKVADFVLSQPFLGIDTESTGLNPYHPGWELRTTQIGNAHRSYVIPAKFRGFVRWLMRQDVKWIGHNGPHDIRCIDVYLGEETGVVCAGETYIPSHHYDSRNRKEGGVGHGLKELAQAHVDISAGKWEVALKAAFKQLTVPMPGVVYKSGKRKGQPRVRKAKLSEGWSLIDPKHPAYVAYAAADPILTYRVWKKFQPVVKEFYELYQFDHKVQVACDRLQRRAIALDRSYTERLSEAFTRRMTEAHERAKAFGCANLHSGRQVAETLMSFGIQLTERTPTGQYKVDDRILRGWLSNVDSPPEMKEFIRAVLLAKQLQKRRESYADAMLREMDAEGRIHPSINTLGARTTRMSVSAPPLQQLPTKDRADDE